MTTTVSTSRDTAPYFNTIEFPCPVCGGNPLYEFYRGEDVPVHSVLLIETRERALSFPTGDITLAYCPNCTFITNTSFDPETQRYSEKYEATQSCSPTFRSFHRKLARDLIDRYDLSGGRVLEIGCGRGEFLHLLTEIDDLEAVGYDPAYPAEQTVHPAEGVTIVPDYYSVDGADRPADLYCCKMTLEHIPNPAAFLQTVREAIGDHSEAVVFFQVPNADRILEEAAFWDIYYEHCSYFTETALRRVFESSGFKVIDVWTAYRDQYLMIDAVPDDGPGGRSVGDSVRPEAFERRIDTFARDVGESLKDWRQLVDQMTEANERVVLWGSGSKAVAFLKTLELRGEVDDVVDINPNRQGTFMAGTGQEIVVPSVLRSCPPDTVIIMNPVYEEEIRADLRAMDLSARVVTVDSPAGARRVPNPEI